MQFSLKALILTLLVATPAAQAVTCKEAAIYTGLGAVGITVGKFCFTDADKFQPMGYDENKSLLDPMNLAAYWHDRIAGFDDKEYKHLGWDTTTTPATPIFKPAIKGQGWVYNIKKMWKPTENFLKFPATVLAALTLVTAFPHLYKNIVHQVSNSCGC